MALTTSVTPTAGVADAVERTRAALAGHGMTATRQKRLDLDAEDFLISGFVHQTIAQDPDIGFPMPGNVVVRTNPDNHCRIIVGALDSLAG